MGRWALAALFVAVIVFQAACTLQSVAAEERRGFVERVVILSIDAARNDIVKRLTAEGELPGFKRVMDEGVVARGMIVSFPSATAVSHAVISTGAPPGVTGITGNRIHLPGTRVYDTVSGFNGAYLQAEPLWAAVDRQGLRAVVAAFPQSTPSHWRDRVNNSVLFNPYDSFLWPVSYSTLYTTNTSIPYATYIQFFDASGWANTSVIGDVSRAYEASFNMGDDVWYLYLADIDGDGYPDKLAIVPRVKDLGRALAVLEEGEWSRPLNTTIVFNNETYVVAPLFKAINLSLVNFRLYRSLMRPFDGDWFTDRELAWDAWNSVVVKTGMITDGDWYALVNGWIDTDTYMETVHYANEFFKEFTLYLMNHTDWNLLMAYTPIIDNVYHEFLGLVDPSMPYYDEEKASVYWSYIVEAHKWADEFLEAILDNVDLGSTVVIVVSDHGQWSVKKLVYINSILYNAGLLKLGEDGGILWNETKAYYVGYNQIFINLQGREEGGVVAPGEYATVVREVMAALESARDPDTGEPVFSLVMTRNESRVFGLFGERAGDIVFSLRPGYAARGGVMVNKSTGEGIVFADVVPLKTITGTHGDLPYYPELIAIFGAIGSGVVHGEIGYVLSTSIAPTIAYLLGIEPPMNSTGIVLPITPPLTTTSTKTVTETATETVAAKPSTVTATRYTVDTGATAAAAVIAIIVGAIAGAYAQKRGIIDRVVALIRR